MGRSLPRFQVGNHCPHSRDTHSARKVYETIMNEEIQQSLVQAKEPGKTRREVEKLGLCPEGVVE